MSASNTLSISTMPLSGVKNKLMIAAAGSGKTTFLFNEALNLNDGKVLITTFTEENEAEIKRYIVKKNGHIPSNIVIQTWFSFLIQHGVKPYQGIFNSRMFGEAVNGLKLVSTTSSAIVDKNGDKVYSKGRLLTYGEADFPKYYFNSKWQVYSDKLSKLVCRSNDSVNGEVINRISRIFRYIFIDEVQDMAGYDLEIIKLLFKSTSNILLVGDPRQVTYLTHHEAKYKKYNDGKIEEFIQKECKKLPIDIDTTSLRASHRNNKQICDYSSKLYPALPESYPCNCMSCRRSTVEHEGIFYVRKTDLGAYMKKYNPIQLRWSISVNTLAEYQAFNIGQSKGKTFDRVLIYPTVPMKKWMADHTFVLTPEARAKLYVAITRAKYSVGIVVDDKNVPVDRVTTFQPD